MTTVQQIRNQFKYCKIGAHTTVGEGADLEEDTVGHCFAALDKISVVSHIVITPTIAVAGVVAHIVVAGHMAAGLAEDMAAAHYCMRH